MLPYLSRNNYSSSRPDAHQISTLLHISIPPLPPPPMAEEKKNIEPSHKVEVKAKKSWSNPALRAMGIPRISLPSRNWMIFWTVLATIGGGIYYDKQEQKAIREKYTNQVKHLAQESYGADRLPRKITVFIAPPPNDFLEESLRHFRKYIKPILVAAAIDYEVYTETRQGDIRSQVAEKIRQMRRGILEEQQKEELARIEHAHNKSWTKFAADTLSNIKSFFRKPDEPEKLASRHDLYDSKDVLGLYRVFQPTTPVRDDVQDPNRCGGIVCIGRGSYKEYINGIQEGLLGPLEKPEVPVVTEPRETETKTENGELPKLAGASDVQKVEASDVQSSEVNNVQKVDTTDVSTAVTTSNEENIQPENDDEPESNEPPVPAPYIVASDYKTGKLAPELDFSRTITNSKGIPVLFEQPVYVFPIPKISGFLRIPEKIYNYFTTRTLAEEVSEKTLIVVNGKSRPFEYKDKYLAGEEEPNWPKKWVEKGKKKNSEWVQDLEVDDRISARLRVFEK